MLELTYINEFIIIIFSLPRLKFHFALGAISLIKYSW